MKTAILTIGPKADIQFLIDLARKMGIEILTLSPGETGTYRLTKAGELIETLSFRKFLG